MYLCMYMYKCINDTVQFAINCNKHESNINFSYSVSNSKLVEVRTHVTCLTNYLIIKTSKFEADDIQKSCNKERNGFYRSHFSLCFNKFYASEIKNFYLCRVFQIDFTVFKSRLLQLGTLCITI